MKAPRMILLDAGCTLFDFASIDTLKGVEAFMPEILDNPEAFTAEEIDEKINHIHNRFGPARMQGYEVPCQSILRSALDSLSLVFKCEIPKIEELYWEHSAAFSPVDGAAELIEGLRARDIRMAVVCNNEFSGKVVSASLDRLFPRNRFEFVITSGDYGMRKPDRMLFEAAMGMSTLEPDQLWYVGDKVNVDVRGALAAGIQPVFFRRYAANKIELPEGVAVADELEQILDWLK